MTALTSLALIIGLSLAAGFATQRGSLCAVAAARDVVHSGKWHRFAAFAQCAAWAWLLVLFVGWFGPHSTASTTAPLMLGTPLAAVAGGALFGIGAWINGGCTFGTVARLASGEVSFLVTVVAMLAGLLLAAGRWPHTAVVAMPLTGIPALALAAWLLRGVLAVMLLVGVVQLVRHRVWRWHVWRKNAWPPALAVLVIAVCIFGFLHLVGQRSGVATPVAALQSESKWLGRWLVLPVFVAAGAVLGAVSGGRFRWVAPDGRAWARRSAGGLIMGVGAAGLPGGNGKMLLVDIPAMHWSGVLAFLAMMIVLFTVMVLVPRHLADADD